MHLLARRTVLALSACLALALGLAACGSSGDKSSSTSSTSSTSSSTSASSGNKAAADAAVKPYIGKPSPFPVTEPLKSVKKGATVAYMDCGTSICGLFWQLLEPAAKTMGVKLTRYKAGSAANTVTQAYDSALAAKPDAVIAAAIDVELWKSQLKKFQADNIPVVTTGILGTQKYGIKAAQAAETASELEGKLMADYTASKFSDAKKIAIYDVPELSFTRLVTQAYQDELKKVCPDCSTRVTHVPVATMGTTAPQQIVSDLQANSGTDLAVFSIDELESGLPAALQTAGIKVKTPRQLAEPDPAAVPQGGQGDRGPGRRPPRPRLDPAGSGRTSDGRPGADRRRGEGHQPGPVPDAGRHQVRPEQGLDRLPRLRAALREAVGRRGLSAETLNRRPGRTRSGRRSSE